MPKNWKETLKLLSKLCKEDIVELCRLQNWCLPSYYPFCFPGQNRSGSSGIIPVISSMTAGSSSTKLLKSMLDITSDVIGFPTLSAAQINPIALELVSGPHALFKANSVLTYMHQLLLKTQNLTRQEMHDELQGFPNEWKFQYTELKSSQFLSTTECDDGCPSWWDAEKFGPWHDLTLVKCKIPPSYKTANSPSNFNTVVIGFRKHPL